MPQPPRAVDVAGVGFGPSNLALAIALGEHNSRAPARRVMSAAFLERQPRFGWHRGMLIDGATMQVSFLKDLVTPRNPASPFGFISYLHSRGRLAAFINHKTFFPSRVEFHDYLEWAAARFAHLVEYDAEVVDIRPVLCGGVPTHLDLFVRRGDGTGSVCRARNVVLATGLRPSLPPGATLTDRIWHSSALLTRIDGWSGAEPRRFLVVGAGQSAAEVAEYLHRRFPGAEVYAVFSRYGYTPADDSAFANGIFDPQAVDTYFAAPDDVKRMLLDYHRNTNYSAVDADLINELYRRAYQENVRGRRRLYILNTSRVRAVEESAGVVRATIETLPSRETSVVAADVLVYATGYQPVDPVDLLGDTREYCALDGQGRVRVDRDYRVVTHGGARFGVYVQGPTEHSHGLASTLLSTTAVRAGEIVHSIREYAGIAPEVESRRGVPV